MRRRDKYKIKTGFNFNILLLILIPIVLVGTTVAKYIDEKNFETTYKANNFYFKSDLLSDSTEQPEYTYAKGIDKISFCLKNNDDSLRYSEVDINYTVTITKENVTIDTKDGTLPKNNTNLERIEFTNLQAGEYIVTAKATSPYEKTLSAKFNISSINENIEYIVTDSENSPVVELTVKTKDYSGNITIAYPEGVVPDNTDSKVESATNSHMTTKMETDSAYIFKFLKINTSNVYNQNDFKVTK